MMRRYDEMPKIKLPNAKDIKISDTTIRDGCQMPGIVMKKSHKLKIFEYLHDMGVEKLETFIYNDRDKDAARAMMDYSYDFPEVTGWARANPADIDEVLKVGGIRETGILMSISDSHIYDKMGLKSYEEAEKKYLNALQYAVDHGLKTRCHIEDTSRANYAFVYPFIRKCIEIDPHTIIRVCDTLGYGVPFPEEEEPYGIPIVVKKLKEIGVKHIEMHVHDDFGLGVANTLAGLWYGADWANLTFLGIGERAGNSELEKIMAFLITRVEGFDKYDLRTVTEFAQYMEDEVGLRVPRNKAIVGKNIFSHESGIHTAGIIKNPFTYEPFPPELVGGKRNLMIGQTSGTEVVRLKAEEALNELLGIEVHVEKSDSRIKSIHNEIQKMYDAEERRSSVSDEEMKDYVRKYFLYQVDGWEEELEERKAKKKLNLTLVNPEFMPLDGIPAAATSLTDKSVKKVKNGSSKKK
ncbi:putative pyruvate carboxyltransferase [Methanocella paludicola SANAE]|uniref:Pyruvate carboxyltransferase n=1 Tax=Methanocella paludicola (strain DSM 17711 / JCM 13418 / NBRC 101707 / SANAE) TaxID=304371 RepID=D1YVP6_METPS|nr:isopropylmalate synthase [Methanocella paludicola]BAI60518.1 putative pyruvate carboxyltransferase [Methanocella paludicola SANAE]